MFERPPQRAATRSTEMPEPGTGGHGSRSTPRAHASERGLRRPASRRIARLLAELLQLVLPLARENGNPNARARQVPRTCEPSPPRAHPGRGSDARATESAPKRAHEAPASTRAPRSSPARRARNKRRALEHRAARRGKVRKAKDALCPQPPPPPTSPPRTSSPRIPTSPAEEQGFVIAADVGGCVGGALGSPRPGAKRVREREPGQLPSPTTPVPGGRWRPSALMPSPAASPVTTPRRKRGRESPVLVRYALRSVHSLQRGRLLHRWGNLFGGGLAARFGDGVGVTTTARGDGRPTTPSGSGPDA